MHEIQPMKEPNLKLNLMDRGCSEAPDIDDPREHFFVVKF